MTSSSILANVVYDRDPFTATRNADGSISLPGMQPNTFRKSGRLHMKRGYAGFLPIGRVKDDGKGKSPWVSGYHGRDHRRPTTAEINAWPDQILARMLNGQRGALNGGVVLPPSLIGIDVDDYERKRGGATIRALERLYGPLPPTDRVTARGPDNRSGICLYKLPDDWTPDMIVPVLKAPDGSTGDVEIILTHIRYVTAPGSVHPSGSMYRRYTPNGRLSSSLLMPQVDELPVVPEAWMDGVLRKRYQVSGTIHVSAPDSELLMVADTWVGEAQPGQLKRTVWFVEETGITGRDTRNATQRALSVAAKKARAGVYPWRTAKAAIKAAAEETRREIGKSFDEADFEHCAVDAIRYAMALTEAEIAGWGVHNGGELAGARVVDGFADRLKEKQDE